MEAGEITVAQEHYASHLVRGRLLSLAQGWGAGNGPLVVVAAPPGEVHDLGLIAFGLVLWRQGWRVTYLGADTPTDALRATVERIRPDLVVVAGSTPEPFEAVASDLADLGDLTTLAVAGEGASDELAERLGARHLAADPVTAAEDTRHPVRPDR